MENMALDLSTIDPSALRNFDPVEAPDTNHPGKNINEPAVKKKLTVQQKEIAHRTQLARRTGANLQKRVNDYIDETGAQAYFKAVYTGPSGKKLVFEAGKSWENMTTAIQSLPSIETIKEVVREGVQQGFGAAISEQLTSTSQSTVGSSLSPQKHAATRARVSKDVCWKCLKKDCFIETVECQFTWIGCSVKACKNFAHDACLGMPGVTEDEIESVPDAYCPTHLLVGVIQKKCSI